MKCIILYSFIIVVVLIFGVCVINNGLCIEECNVIVFVIWVEVVFEMC